MVTIKEIPIIKMAAFVENEPGDLVVVDKAHPLSLSHSLL